MRYSGLRSSFVSAIDIYHINCLERFKQWRPHEMSMVSYPLDRAVRCAVRWLYSLAEKIRVGRKRACRRVTPTIGKLAIKTLYKVSEAM